MPFSLYLHVPFCKSRCIYCDFYSTTCCDVPRLEAYAQALTVEMKAREHEAHGPLRSIYLGGGTPSLLPVEAVAQIIGQAQRLFTPSSDAEITLEANPDDVTRERAEAWRRAGVNRVSLGLQSLSDGMLRLLHRRHSATQAVRAVELCCQAGLSNISADLIYGLPGQVPDAFEADLRATLGLPITHLSAYSLTVEGAHTALSRGLKTGRYSLPPEEEVVEMYRRLTKLSEAAGFEHYEISNFARAGHRSRHNSAYWTSLPYIGLGPGAHSYDGENLRRSNDANLEAYLRCPQDPPHHTERLTPTDRHNEYVMTAMRRREGIDLCDYTQRYGSKYTQRLLQLARPFVKDHLLYPPESSGALRLTREGVLLCDEVIREWMIIQV